MDGSVSVCNLMLDRISIGFGIFVFMAKKVNAPAETNKGSDKKKGTAE
jgi:hypothetical protein